MLSACDTHRGTLLHAGQGVASLQQAFRMAGARTVIASLWKVPDAATKQLMVDFYRRLWTGGESKIDALRHAKEAVRAAGRPPAEWAAWILCGEPE